MKTRRKESKIGDIMRDNVITWIRQDGKLVQKHNPAKQISCDRIKEGEYTYTIYSGDAVVARLLKEEHFIKEEEE